MLSAESSSSVDRLIFYLMQTKLGCMGTITFDTHGFIKRLEKADFSEDQAEALADALKQVQSESEGRLATRVDLHLALAELKTDLMKFIFAALLTQVALIVAFIKLF